MEKLDPDNPCENQRFLVEWFRERKQLKEFVTAYNKMVSRLNKFAQLRKFKEKYPKTDIEDLFYPLPINEEMHFGVESLEINVHIKTKALEIIRKELSSFGIIDDIQNLNKN